MALLSFGEFRRLEDGCDIFCYGEFAKDGWLLCKIADAKLCASVHGIVCDAYIGQVNIAVCRLLKTDDHIECRCFACTIGAKETYDLTFFDTDRDVVNDNTAAEFLDETAGFELQDKGVPSSAR